LQIGFRFPFVADECDERHVVDGVRLAPELGRRLRAVTRRDVKMAVILSKQKVSTVIRVTGLGEFSPSGQFFTWDSF
jgi:hypothetical protein